MPRRVPFLDYEKLAAVAANFLAEFDGASNPPVDIEWLIEESGLQIVPMENLYRNYGIDGFLTCDLKYIYVDEAQYRASASFRFRFTLAHEMAHYLAHRELLVSLGVHHPGDSDGGIRGLSQSEYNDLEYQANMIAGMILVPEADLKKRAQGLAEALSGLDYDTKVENAADLLFRKYQVSKQVVWIRIEKEEILD